MLAGCDFREMLHLENSLVIDPPTVRCSPSAATYFDNMLSTSASSQNRPAPQLVINFPRDVTIFDSLYFLNKLELKQS